MTATGSLTVPYSIKPICQYIFDCLGKRSIKSISKIVDFGAQKIQTSSLRSQCIHNEWLFGADCGTVASLGHFSSKMYWAEVCDVSCDEFFFSSFFVWSKRQSLIYRKVIFYQKTCLTTKKKFVKFDPGKPFMDKLVKLSRELTEAQKLTSVFDCSHIVLHLKKYKLKFTTQRRLRPWNTKSKLPFMGLKPKQSKMYWKVRLVEWGTVRPAKAAI